MQIGLYHSAKEPWRIWRIVSEDSLLSQVACWLSALVTLSLLRVVRDAPDIPAYSQIYLRNYNGQFIVTAAIHWGLSSELLLTLRRDDPSP